MKNFKKISVAILFSMVFCFGYSFNLPPLINDFNCESCNLNSTLVCTNGLGDFDNLEFASAYKYNSSNFTSCDLNKVDSEYRLKNEINAIIKQLELFDDHLHYMTSKIKKQHKNFNATTAVVPYNYAIISDSSAAHHQKVVDYGIKLKLKGLNKK